MPRLLMLLLISGCLIFGYKLQAQTSQDTVPLPTDQRLEKIEHKVSSLEEQLDLEVIVERKVKSYYDKEWLSWFVKFLATAVALLGGFAYLYKTVVQRAEQVFLEKVSETIESKKEIIQDMVSWEELTQYLIKQSNVLIVYQPQNDRLESPIHQLLKDLSFPEVSTRPLNLQRSFLHGGEIPPYAKIYDKPYKVVIIDDENRKVAPIIPAKEKGGRSEDDMRWVDAIIAQVPDHIPVFYFGSAHVNLTNPDFSEKRRNTLAFASVRAQIYGNLMNLISMQARMKRR
ncbi:MAG: hypothetical protein AAFW00_19655 [Bacteroidota bacterium]